MIEIPEKSDIKDIEGKMEAICRHLKIKLIPKISTIGYTWSAVDHWPFEGGFPREPLSKESPNYGLCGMSFPPGKKLDTDKKR